MRKACMMAALLVLLGASLLPAAAYPIHLFPQPFVKDGTIDYDFDGMPDVAIILGSKAAPEDVLGATLIAAKMGSHLYYTNALYVDERDAANHGITLYHGSFSAQAYGQRYQALDLVGSWEWEHFFKGFLWSWNWDPAAGEPNPFRMLYPLYDDYVFVPASVKSAKNPTQIRYSVGRKFGTSALKEWVVFATSTGSTYYPPAYNDYEKAAYWSVPLTLDCPGTFTFGADAFDSVKNFHADYVGTITYTWAHAGFYFIHPLNPIDIAIGTKVDLPWLGYTLEAKEVEAGTTSYSVGFVAYKLGTTTPVDYFHIESINPGTVPQDNNPTSFEFFLYSITHRDLYILADINGDGRISSNERLTTYFGITVRDVDEALDVVTMDFYSLILAPNIYPGHGYSTAADDRRYDWDNTAWYFASDYGWPHPAGSDYAHAANLTWPYGSMNVDVILEKSSYPDPSGPKVFAGGNMGLTWSTGMYPAEVTIFHDAKGYIVDTSKVFAPWVNKLAADESFLGISGYLNAYTLVDEWYLVVKSGVLGATIFVQDETGWYKPLNTDGKLVVGGKELWFTSVISGVATAYQECPALPPTVGAEYCGPMCGPTWGIYNFTQGEKILTKVECKTFLKDYEDELDDILSGYTSIYPTSGICPKLLVQDTYATGEDEDVTTAVWHWQLNWFYPINATGVFAGIYDRVEDRNKDGVFTGATELVPVTTAEGKTVFEDVTPAAYKDLYFNFANPEEVFSFVRAPIAYMDSWVFDGKALSDDVKNKKLILVGGPLVNSLVKYLNDTGALYILYKTDGKVTWLYNPLAAPGERNVNLTYALSLIDPTIDPSYVYKIEGGNGLGVIQYAKSNPLTDKEILVVAGTDRFGTLSASIALADPTKLANTTTISTYYNAGVGKVAPAVIVIGIRPTTVPTKVVIQPVLVVPVGLPSS
ncbi:S-layer protein [Candidatus Korarchaeum cryptofilum]|uniref:S-layer protein n=1 Tax=Candidatus Korarchaeum cryptofilum TaxID=498846 RepID=A0A429G8E1_9CREN|nr:S-layer protein [Candidatus Korarchaeum cryptofilum]RSN70022.1 S-layer protein [Candidatus Korarchaeum cryptofilum]